MSRPALRVLMKPDSFFRVCREFAFRERCRGWQHPRYVALFLNKEVPRESDWEKCVETVPSGLSSSTCVPFAEDHNCYGRRWLSKRRLRFEKENQKGKTISNHISKHVGSGNTLFVGFQLRNIRTKDCFFSTCLVTVFLVGLRSHRIGPLFWNSGIACVSHSFSCT